MPTSDDQMRESTNGGGPAPEWRDLEEELQVGSGVPSNEVLLLPILQVLSDGLPRDTGALAEAVADKLHLGAEVRSQRLPNGRTALVNRIGWARTGLVKAGLAEQPARGQLVITSAGVNFCAAHPAGEAISDETLAKECPPFASWLADMGREAYLRSRGDDPNPTVWMVRAGEAGVYAPLFVEHSLAMLGWSEAGSVEGLSLEDILAAVSRAFPEMRKAQRGQAANALARFAVEMQPDDLVVTPESRTRTILLGRVVGPYRYLDQPLAGDYNHVRPVKWFARFSRDDLSYGAQNTLGSLLTLTKPSHEAELLGLAELHQGDAPPLPLSQTTAAAPRDPVRERVVIPLNATAPPRPTLGDFQTVPRRMMQLLNELHSGQLALPDFQRTFVWAPDETRELLVSMVRSFPAGALLFLQGGSSTFKARAAEGAPLLATRPSYLVLDGQQRLTSLYQAMTGTGDARFFLDIGALLSGADINDAVRVFSVARAMPFATLEAQARTMMMPLSSVRDGGAGRWRDDVVDLRADEDAPRVRRLLSDVERAFIDPLVQYAFPVTILPEATPLEAVCTIFETLNRTGKPLTPFELISARAFAGGHSLYDYWSAAKERHPIVSDFDIQPYYLLQIIALRLGLSCKHSSVLSLNPEDIARNWDAVVADTAAVLTMLRDECGVLIARWLPYRPMLIPLAGAWRQVAGATGPAQGAMRAKLKRWFWCACFTGEYESSSASLAERDTPDLRDWLAGGDEPPVVQQFEWKPEQWRAVGIRQQGVYRATMALSLIGRPRDFHSGAPLTPALIEAGKIDDHHVFPRGYLKDIGKADLFDPVINHCLIDRATNIRIGKKAPSVYLNEIRGELGSELDHVLASHHLRLEPRPH